MRRFRVAALVIFVALLVPQGAPAGEPVWGKDLVAGKEFPLPFGVSAVYFHQEQEYALEELAIGLPGLPPLPAEAFRIENEIDEVNAKFDAWLLPYLNVFAIAGELDGDTHIDFSALGPLLGLPISAIDISYDGEVYGGGVVLAAGGDVVFGSLTAIGTTTSLGGDFESDVRAFVATPRVGVYNRRGSLYVGAMYQDATEEHQGTVLFPVLGPVPFEVKLKQSEDWNWVAGITAALGEHWTAQAEGGFGDRDHVDVEIAYRF